MKKYLLILALAVALPAGAQRNNRGDNEADRSARATERIERQAKSLVKELDLNDADAEVFTKLYVEYQDTLRGLRASQPRPDRRQKRDEITDEEADRRITSAIAFSRQEADLKEAYYVRASADDDAPSGKQQSSSLWWTAGWRFRTGMVS